MPVDKPTPEQLAYWERVLKDHKLGMDRGATLGGHRFCPLRDDDREKKDGVNG